MGCSNVGKPVFVESNLGTCLAAVPVSPDITAKEFKRELERTHLSCFPEFGKVTVNALMVKQKSRFYHLSNSLPLKHAFPDSNGIWLLQINAHTQCIPGQTESLLNCKDTEILNLSAANVVSRSDGLRDPKFCTDRKRIKHKRKHAVIQRFPFFKAALLKGKKKRKNRKPKTGPLQQPLIEKKIRCQFAELNRTETDMISEARNETFSESVSVSGIINKYFSDYDEVASTSFSTVLSRHEFKSLDFKCDVISPAMGRVSKYVCLENPGSEASREKHKNPEIGKRLLVASDNLGPSPSNQQPALSLCRYSTRESSFHKSSFIRNLVFEVTEESD